MSESPSNRDPECKIVGTYWPVDACIFGEHVKEVAPHAGWKFGPGGKVEVRGIRRSQAKDVANALGMNGELLAQQPYEIIEYPEE